MRIRHTRRENVEYFPLKTGEKRVFRDISDENRGVDRFYVKLHREADAQKMENEISGIQWFSRKK